MPWIEIITILLPLLIEFLPVILDLFDKDAKARVEAVPKFDAMFLRATKAGSMAGMFVAQLGGCICRMNDEQFANFKKSASGIIAAMREAADKMKKEDDS